MESPQQPSAGSCSTTAQVVGNAFVHQYYRMLHQSPELVYRFYQNRSKLGRPKPDGTFCSITTMQAINKEILFLDYSDCRVEIKTVDAQESHKDGVIVLVTGFLTGQDDVRRNFTQSFFLAPQDKGYFVLNDLFRYVEEEVEHHGGNQSMPNAVAAHLTSEQDPAPIAEQPTSLPEEEINGEEVYNPSDNEESSVVEEEVPTAEVVDDIPKKSYASILKVTKEIRRRRGRTPSTAWPAPSNQERLVVPTPPLMLMQVKAKIEIEGPMPSPAWPAPSNQERLVVPTPPLMQVKVKKEIGGPTPSPAWPTPSNQERLVVPTPPLMQVKVEKEIGGPTPSPAWPAPSNQERLVVPTPPLMQVKVEKEIGGPTPSPAWPAPSNQERLVVPTPPLMQVKVEKEIGGPTPSPAWPAPSNQERLVVPTPPPASAAQTPVSSSNTTEGGNNQEGESDGYSIYIKNLPLNATPAQLEEEFKKFGPIKSGGVQVRSNKRQEFCFGFVEFELATAVQGAIEASPITIGGRQAVVEEKRPSSSRVNRGRFPPGRGNSFRNDGARGRGN